MHFNYQAMSLHLSGPGSSFAKCGGKTTESALEGPFPHERSVVSVITQSSCNHCREMTCRNTQPSSQVRTRAWRPEHVGFSFQPNSWHLFGGLPSEGLSWFSRCAPRISIFPMGSAASVLSEGFI